MRSSLLASLCLAVAALAAPAAYAADDPKVIITSGSMPDGGAYSFSDDWWEGVGFRMGADALYVYDVTFRLEAASAATASLTLFSADPSVPYSTPLAAIGSFGNVQVGARGDYTFRPTATMELAANQLYWLVLRGTPNAGLKYVETTGPLSGDYASPYTSEVGARGHDFAATFDNGANWFVHSGLDAIEVRGTVTPVPEPSTYILLLMGGLSILCTARRQPKA